MTNLLGKMVEEMKSGDDVLRTKVLREINEDYHQADKLNLSLDSEILFQLVHCCRESDNTIRELASSAILKIANTEMGRNTLIQSKTLAIISGLFDDKVT